MFTLVEQHIHVETVTPAKLMHSHRNSLRHPHLTLITAEALNWLIDIVLIILQPTETVNRAVRAPDADAQPTRLRGSRQTERHHATSCTASTDMIIPVLILKDVNHVVPH